MVLLILLVSIVISLVLGMVIHNESSLEEIDLDMLPDDGFKELLINTELNVKTRKFEVRV